MMKQQVYNEIRNQLSFEKSNTILTQHLLIDFGLLSAVAAATYSESVLGYMLGSILLSAFFFRSFSMMHDAVHKALSNNQKLNQILGYIYGGFCFLPFEAWREIHVKHHMWSSNVEKDPTMALVKNFKDSSVFKNRLLSAAWRTWIPLLGFLQFVVFWKYNGKLLKESKSSRVPMLLSFLIPGLIYLSVALLAPMEFFFFTMAPGFVLYLVLVEVINFPHHLQMPMRQGNARVRFNDHHKICRSCEYSSWFEKLVLLNFNYHIEHHLYPDLPWHQLKKASELVKNELGDSYNGIKSNGWIKKNRKVKLDKILKPTWEEPQTISPPAA